MKLLAIGPRSHLKINRVSGQTVLFDGFIDYCEKNCIKVDVLDLFPKIDKPGNIYRIIDYIFSASVLVCFLIKSCVTKKYDACYFTTSFSRYGVLRDLVLTRILLFFRVKVVAHQLGAGVNHFIEAKDSIGEKRLRKLLKAYSAIVVEGNYIRDQFFVFEEIREKIFVIPNGLPKCGKNALHSKEYIKGQTFNIFYLSNLIYTKGWHDVLMAVNELVNNRGLNVKCIFAGLFMQSKDDPTPMIYTKEYFFDYIKNNNLETHIEYYDGLFGTEKDEYFLKAHVFILPSFYYNEGQPVSILEAMSYGCVPIVTNYRHIPMMVTDANGCFVKPHNPNNIADTIMGLINAPNTYCRKSEKCVADFQMNYTFEQYMMQLISVIKTS